jgi:NAD+ synthase (glutamine-hydrolysing)
VRFFPAHGKLFFFFSEVLWSLGKRTSLAKEVRFFPAHRSEKMNHGFVKVAAVTTDIKVANVEYNTKEICKGIAEATDNGAKIVVLPELVITGYTCGDLFAQELLLKQTQIALDEITEFTSNIDALVFIGLPFSYHGKLFNVVATLNKGSILGFTTKTYLPNYRDMYEMRHFAPGPDVARNIEYNGHLIPFGPNLLFYSPEMKELIVSVEVCEDLWAPIPQGVHAVLEGATVIVNSSASTDTIGKYQVRHDLIKSHSMRLISGYIYANAGAGESTTDGVFGGHNLIVEDGQVLAQANEFKNGIIYSDLDINRIVGERQKNTTFRLKNESELWRIPFNVTLDKLGEEITRVFPKTPFVPEDPKELERACGEALQIQALGLKKRLEHTRAKTAVIGISGGLDSTLALLVVNKAFNMLGKDKKEIVAVTMPCFGTTKRTYENGIALAQLLGTTVMEIPIEEAVLQHFKDIGHNPEIQDITYENAQARERTQILMNLANQMNGLVIGTGSMSELALGWATYNGDHMSMYGVNSSVPKTLVKHLIGYEVSRLESKEIGEFTSEEVINEIIEDILDTPISPELLPPKGGETSQITEDLVGPYRLHDFFLYYMLRYNYAPSKIYKIAVATFDEEYDSETILRWLKVFYKRFFSQQFKRSCMPDSPTIGPVSLSPRGSFRMPSDGCVDLWLEDLEKERDMLE